MKLLSQTEKFDGWVVSSTDKPTGTANSPLKDIGPVLFRTELRPTMYSQ